MKFRSEVSRIAEAFNQRALPFVEIIIVSRKGDIEADYFDRISLKNVGRNFFHCAKGTLNFSEPNESIYLLFAWRIIA